MRILAAHELRTAIRAFQPRLIDNNGECGAEFGWFLSIRAITQINCCSGGFRTSCYYSPPGSVIRNGGGLGLAVCHRQRGGISISGNGGG